MTLQEVFSEFMYDKRLQGLSEKSIASYDCHISMFLSYVGRGVHIEKLTKKQVDAYVFDLFGRSLSKSTVSTYVRNARIFLCWAYMEHDMLFDPHKIKVPKPPKKKVHILSDREIALIFSSVETSYAWITARNKAIVAFMLDSGVRQGEVCTLLYRNFDYERKVFKVCGKGAKERLVPFGKISMTLMQEYISLCPYKGREHVFLDRMGNPLSGNAVRVFVNRLKQKTGIDICSHKFRHNFATNYCIDNIRKCGHSNVYDLSIIMGHESIETTKKYEHFAHEMIAVENSISHLDMVFSSGIFKNQYV